MVVGEPSNGHVVVGMRFEGERIVVSGRRFERCSFIRCELVFDGRPAQLVDNHIETCRWAFEEAAGLTLEFLISLCRYDPVVRAMIAGELGLGDSKLPAGDLAGRLGQGGKGRRAEAARAGRTAH